MIDLFSAQPDLRKQAVFLHDTQDRLGIAVDTSLLQHQLSKPLGIVSPLMQFHFPALGGPIFHYSFVCLFTSLKQPDLLA